jgi:lysyl-tRNA synthetase class I
MAPRGLPHIGTFGEVLRTTMIRRAFEVISDIPTRLICFSDDMDGMRKVPGNVPNQDMLREHLQKPLTSVPDPFGTHESFGHHNNAMLRRFLDTFGFEYEFYSATDFYASGQFDEILLRAAERYDALMKVMLKSLREERQQTYSIFLPMHPETGRVLYVPIKHVDAKDGHRHLRRRGGPRMDRARHRRQVQAAVEARFRRALGRARRRFRDVWQGPFDQHADLRRDLRDPRGARAGAFHL